MDFYSNVKLVPHHKYIRAGNITKARKDGVHLIEEMLSWNILHNKTQYSDIEEAMYRNILKALSSLNSFEVFMSIKVDAKEKALTKVLRDWAVIYFQDEWVASFTHNWNKKNDPYISALEWSDDKNNSPLLWDVKKWERHIKERVVQYRNKNISNAKIEIKKNQKKIDFSKKVLEFI
jgi:hypothetical protein